MIRYSKVTTQKGTIYSHAKGHTIERRGDTLIIRHEAYGREAHVPWSFVEEADHDAPASKPK